LKYRGWNQDKAVEDYYSRIRDHEKHYEPLEEITWPSIRIINVCPCSGGSVIGNSPLLGWREDDDEC
jgi:hypothetical protein